MVATDEEQRLEEYIRFVRTLEEVMDQKQFADFVKDLVLSILESRDNSKAHRENKKTANKFYVHLHVDLAMHQLAAGTLRQNLVLAIDRLLLRCLTQCLEYLNTANNLKLLHTMIKSSSAAGLALWFHYAETSVNRDVLAHRFNARGGQSRNEGARSEALELTDCAFPYSWRLFHFFENADLKSVVQQGDIALSSTPVEQATARIEAVASPLTEALGLCTAWRADFAEVYLQDFAWLVQHTFASIPAETMRALVQLMVRATLLNKLAIPSIHAAFWTAHRHLTLFTNIMSLFPSFHEPLLAALQAVLPAALARPTGVEALQQLDFAFVQTLLKLLLGHLEESTAPLPPAQEKRPVLAPTAAPLPVTTPAPAPLEPGTLESKNAAEVVALLLRGRGDLERLFSLINTALPADQVLPLHLSWLAIRLAVLVFQEASLVLRAPVLRQFLQQQLPVEPWTLGGLQRLTSFVVNNFVPEKAEDAVRVAYGFLTHLFTDIVFGHTWGNTTLPFPLPLAGPLVEELIAMVVDCGHGTLLPATLCTVNLRRVILECLTRDEACKERFFATGLSSVESSLMYLFLVEDRLAEASSTPSEAEVTLALQPWTGTLAQAGNKSFLEKVALVRAQVQRACHAVATHAAGTPIPPEGTLGGALKKEISDIKTFVHMFGLKSLLSKVGLDQFINLLSTLHSNKMLDWIKLAPSAPKVSVSLPDALILLAPDKDTYAQLCSTVRSGSSGSVPIRQLAVQLPPEKLRGQREAILAAVCSQLVLDRDFATLANPNVGNYLTDEMSKVMEPKEHDFLAWILKGCKTPSATELPTAVAAAAAAAAPAPAAAPAEPTTKIHEDLLLQLALHLGLRALRRPDSWEYALLFSTSSLTKAFLPAMPGSFMGVIMRAAGNLGWYKCPNGHIYAVGNCTRPMEEAICKFPGCGAVIGGQNHVSAKGNVRIDTTTLTEDAPQGYVNVPEKDCDDIARLSKISCRIFRLLTHLLLRTAIVSSPHRHARVVAAFVGGEAQQHNPGGMLQQITESLEADWATLLRLTGANENDLALLMHGVINNMESLRGSNTGLQALASNQARESFETLFEGKCITPVFGRDRREFVTAFHKELKESNRVAQLQVLLSDDRYLALFERDLEAPIPAGRGLASLDRRLWQSREVLTFEAFEQAFNSRPAYAKDFPLVAQLLREELRVGLVKYIGDILAWHALLFEVLPMYSITREEARFMSNHDVLGRLPESRRAEGLAVLDRYCVAFNAAFPLVKELYECNPNPFLTKDGRVDFGMSNGKAPAEVMNRNTPIFFSLPYMATGETEAQGLCTIRLLQELQNCHNTLMDVLVPGRAVADQSTMVSYATHPDVLRRLLIVYDRQQHLMPLLHLNVDQEIEYSSGGQLTFNMAGIQAAVANSIVGAAVHLVVHTHPYSFAGDLQKTGLITKLANKCPQQPLDGGLRSAIEREVTTQMQALELVQTLQVCCDFVATLNVTPMSKAAAAVTLESYVLRARLLPLARWQEIAPSSVRQGVCLHHLQALILMLEEQQSNSFLDRMMDRYRESLPAALERDLIKAAATMQLGLLLPVIRDLIDKDLQTDAFDPAHELKMYLESRTDIALEEQDWFERSFPTNLTLAHTYAVYMLVSDLHRRNTA